jgi:hypothetical protein
MSEKPSAILIVSILRKLLKCQSFRERHRVSPRSFTRQRKLSFSWVMLMLLQKSLKSLQLRLHEFYDQIADWALEESATASAFSQARCKLRHTAFIELNQVGILKPLEETQAHRRRWKGHRLLAADTSLVRLPDEDEIWERFGGQKPVNQSGSCGVRVPQARLSVLYDVLNRLGLETRVEGFCTGEASIVREHFSLLKPGDVLLLDRLFAGYELFAKVLACGADFVCRCQTRSFKAVAELFARDEAGVSQIVTLKAPARALKAGLPAQLRVRLVTLRLSTGELEVLATSLLDEAAYPKEDFGWVYIQRWGIETYYGVLKGRLDLENFSGRTLEAVLQDIHATVFLSNLESVVTAPVADSLPSPGKDGRKHGVKINRAVSFHAIKSRMFDLLMGPGSVEQILRKLQRLFVANLVTVRPERRPPRKPPTALRTANYMKTTRKIVF